jgi:hypothetical protein
VLPVRKQIHDRNLNLQVIESRRNVHRASARCAERHGIGLSARREGVKRFDRCQSESMTEDRARPLAMVAVHFTGVARVNTMWTGSVENAKRFKWLLRNVIALRVTGWVRFRTFAG